MVCSAQRMEEEKIADKIIIVEHVGNLVCSAPKVMGEVVCSAPAMRGELSCDVDERRKKLRKPADLPQEEGRG